MKYLVGTLCVLGLVLAAGWIYERLGQARDRKRYPPPGCLQRVNGHRLHLHCMGERHPQQPTVILEAGMASCSFDWRLVQPAVARWARVCSYDRAGSGWSEGAYPARSAAQMAGELAVLLASAGEPGPYVLVGHSFGGILVREFARQHPQNVVGMVLVDSAHESQISRLSAAEFKQLEASLRVYRVLAFLAHLGVVRLLARPLLLSHFPSARSPQEQGILMALVSRPNYWSTLCAESQALMTSSTLTLPALGQMPLVVVQAAGQPDHLPRGYSKERWQQTRAMLNEIQRDLAGLSSRSQLVQAFQSVHAVQLEEPDLVIGAVRQVLDTLSEKHKHPAR